MVNIWTKKKHYDMMPVKVYGDNEGESYSDANDDDPRTIQQSKHNQILFNNSFSAFFVI